MREEREGRGERRREVGERGKKRKYLSWRKRGKVGSKQAKEKDPRKTHPEMSKTTGSRTRVQKDVLRGC